MANYKMNQKGMRQLANSSGVAQAAVRAAERGKAYAESISPVGRTGDYKRSFEVEQVPVEVPSGGRMETRAGAVLRNTAPHSLPVEGSHRVLRRTVEHIEDGG